MKRTLTLILALLMALSLIGSAMAEGHTATVAVDDDSFTIGPWGGDGAVRDWTETVLWTHLCYRPFVGAALEKDELEMVAAKAVTKVDATTYEVEINEGITDSQGNAITAADVVFSYDTLAKLGYVTEIGLYYDHAEAADDTHLTIYLKDDTEGAIEEILCHCSIASQAWYEGASQDEVESNPATTGPYTVTGVETASSITMTARPDYWKSENLSTVELQNADEIVIRCITEASMRSIALENGEVDMAEISSTDVARFEGDDNYNITNYDNFMSQYLIFNTSENSPCQDENVRKAIAYGFDCMIMLMGGGSTAGIVSYDVAPNMAPDYVQEWDTREYFPWDPEKAAQYLADAGYQPGELNIRLLVTAQAPQGPYQALQAMLMQSGINMEICGYDRALRQTYQDDPTAWDIAEYSDSITDFTTHFWADLFSEKNYGENGTQGFTVDPTLQELLAAASADRSEENMNAFHDYVAEHCYMIGLYTEIRSIVTNAGITDICLQKLNPILNAMTFAD